MIGKVIYNVYSSKSELEKYQQHIRDIEWGAIVNKIPTNSTFLDVGCGAGYAMYKAKAERNCLVYGVDPDPGGHGVGRFLEKFPKAEVNIQQAFAEKLPFEDEFFDVVYSSHVLEHVNDEAQALKEMKRVLNQEGIAIIGMPTVTMAWINWFSQIVFTTHVKLYEFFRFLFTKNPIKQFARIFRIYSHSSPRASSIWYDIQHYRVKNWRKIVEKEFEIKEVILPCLYPYPDYPQWFNLRKSKKRASSVFFVCKKYETSKTIE